MDCLNECLFCFELTVDMQVPKYLIKPTKRQSIKFKIGYSEIILL